MLSRFRKPEQIMNFDFRGYRFNTYLNEDTNLGIAEVEFSNSLTTMSLTCYSNIDRFFQHGKTLTLFFDQIQEDNDIQEPMRILVEASFLSRFVESPFSLSVHHLKIMRGDEVVINF